MPKEPQKDLHSITLDLTPEAFAELEELKEKCKKPSHGETIRAGLKMLQWLFENSENGNEIFVKKGNKLVKIEIDI